MTDPRTVDWNQPPSPSDEVGAEYLRMARLVKDAYYRDMGMEIDENVTPS